MKAMKKLLGVLLVLSLVLSFGAVTAFATTTPQTAEENKYEGDVGTLKDVADTTMTFDKYLVLNKGADVPDVQFKFVIEAATDGDSTGEGATGTTLKHINPIDRADVYNAADDEGKAAIDAGDSSAYTVIGKPVFVAVDGQIALGTLTYTGDTALVTYKKGDTTKDESTYRDATTQQVTGKTVAFMTDPSDTGAKHWYPNDEKVAEKTLTVDFSGVTFLEPGVYRYLITEVKADTTPKLPGMVCDPDGVVNCVRYLDVYVTDNAGELAVSGYVLHKASTLTFGDQHFDPGIMDEAVQGTMDVNLNGDKLDDKSTGFTNQYDTKSLAFKKEVSGNQASRDKFFKYTVTVTPPADIKEDFEASWFEIQMADSASSWVWEPDQNVATDDAYTMAIMKNANDPNTASNMKIEAGRVYIKGSALIEGKDFYLQHGNYIMIRNLPAAATYNVAEQAEDYQSAAAAVTNYKNATTGVLKEQDGYYETNGTAIITPDMPDDIVFTSYKNTREGVIPTGLLTVVGPAVALIALAGAGFGIVLASKRRHEDED